MANNSFLELQKVLDQIGIEVDDTMKVATVEAAKQGVKELKASSKQKFGNGPYAKGWTYKKTQDGYVIYNKQYQLTHLLEHGHDIVANGAKVGRYSGEVHIKPVEEDVIELFEKKLEEGLSNL